MAGLTRYFNFTPLFPSRSLDPYILGGNFPIKDDVLFVKKVVLLSIMKLSIHIHVAISKSKSKNSPEYNYRV